MNENMEKVKMYNAPTSAGVLILENSPKMIEFGVDVRRMVSGLCDRDSPWKYQKPATPSIGQSWDCPLNPIRIESGKHDLLLDLKFHWSQKQAQPPGFSITVTPSISIGLLTGPLQNQGDSFQALIDVGEFVKGLKQMLRREGITCI